MVAGRVGHPIEQEIRVAPERGERPTSQQGRRGVEFQVTAVQLHGDPGIGHRGTDGLVAGQRTGRAVDQEQLKLGTYLAGGPEARQLEELRERGHAFPEPLGKAE